MAILDMLQRKQGFTSTEEALADYVLANPDEVAEMSIAQLSSVAHVSNAAVVRFCQKLGIEGYRAFRIELARELERARTHVYDVNPDQPFFEDANTKDIVSSIAALEKQAIDETYAMLDMHNVRKAARFVRGARKVVLYGVGDTRISLISFSNLLLKLGITCIDGNQYGDNMVVTSFLGPKDVALFASYSGAQIDSLNQELKTLRSQGTKTIFITADDATEQRLGKADCFILLPKSENRLRRIATFYSQECFRLVLNCIYGEVFSQGWNESMAAREHYVSSTGWEH